MNSSDEWFCATRMFSVCSIALQRWSGRLEASDSTNEPRNLNGALSSLAYNPANVTLISAHSPAVPEAESTDSVSIISASGGILISKCNFSSTN